MASVEVSTMGGATAEVAPHDEQDEVVLSPVSAAEPVNPMNNDLRMYTKSVEQAASEDNASCKAEDAVKEAQEGTEATITVVAKSTSGDAEQENKPVVVAAAQDEEEPVVPAPSDEVTQDELNKKLAAPIPFSGVRSRSFNLLPRSMSKDNNNNNSSSSSALKAYPMQRALSFDSKKKKASTEGTVTKGGGIPLFRKLSFRGKKEAKNKKEEEQQQAAARPPLASPPKPPRPPTPPQKEEASPEEASPKQVVEEKPSKEPKEEKFQEEKKETDFEAALSQTLAKRNPSLISTRSKESESPSVAAVGLPKNDSLISTRSKESAAALSPKPPVAGSIIAELVSRRNEGKIQRTPTFQMENDDGDEPAPAAVPKEEPSTTAEATAEAAPVVEEQVVKPAESSSESSKPAGEATEEKAVEEKAAAAVDAAPQAQEEEPQPAQEEDAAAKTTKKEDNAEDSATEATEVEGEGGAPMVKEETKNGLVINSSASEVEVSAGSGFNFCEKFCCGLTLATAPSN